MEAVCKLQFLLLIHMCIYSIFVKAVFLFSPKNFSFLPPKLCPVCSPQYWKSGLSSRVSVDYSVHHLPKWRRVQRHLQIRNTTWSHSQQINASISECCGHVKPGTTSKLQNSQKKYWFWCTKSISASACKAGGWTVTLSYPYGNRKTFPFNFFFFFYYSLHLQSLHVVTGYFPTSACQGSLNIFLKMAKKVVIVWKKTFFLPRSSAHHVPISPACCQ